MLRDCVARCPDDLWSRGAHPRTFWRIAYHATYIAGSVSSGDLFGWRSRRNTSAFPFVSPATRFVAAARNTTKRPSSVIAGSVEAPFPSAPSEVREMRLVVPAIRLRMKMSEAPFVSPTTRFEACDSKTTRLPSAVMSLWSLGPFACSPDLEIETRSVVPYWPNAVVIDHSDKATRMNRSYRMVFLQEKCLSNPGAAQVTDFHALENQTTPPR